MSDLIYGVRVAAALVAVHGEGDCSEVEWQLGGDLGSFLCMILVKLLTGNLKSICWRTREQTNLLLNSFSTT